MHSKYSALVAMIVLLCGHSVSAAHKTTVSIGLNESKPVCPRLMGIFFEDLSYAADGGKLLPVVETQRVDSSVALALDTNSRTIIPIPAK